MKMPAQATHRLLLRAELLRADEQIVTHTMEISESLAFVRTDEMAYIGDKIFVNFSFPGLVAPFSLETQVIAQQLASGPGRPGGWTLGFVFYNKQEQERLRELLSQVQSPAEGESSFTYRVLLVDDNFMTREAVSYAAAKFFGADSPVHVDIATDGQDAWRRLHDEPYDLAIVDYFMPMLNGDQLISQLRREPSLSDLPIFAISIGGPEAREKSLAAGADVFLQKPLVLHDLFYTLKQLTSSRQQQGSAA